jgi:hypothetical protein
MLTGRCQCGGVRYEYGGKPGRLYVCHCRECQRLSVSAFSISLEATRAGFRLTQGMPKVWSRSADSGGTVRCNFCPDCGSRLWHEPSADSEFLTIKGGSLDQPPDLTNAIHIWTSRKLPGVVIPEGAPQYPGEPD